MRIFVFFLSNDLRDNFASRQAGLAAKAGSLKTSVGLRPGQDSKGASCLAGVTLAAKPCFLPVGYRLVRSTALTARHLHSRNTSLVKLTSAGKESVTKLWLKDVLFWLHLLTEWSVVTLIYWCFTLAKLLLPRREKSSTNGRPIQTIVMEFKIGSYIGMDLVKWKTISPWHIHITTTVAQACNYRSDTSLKSFLVAEERLPSSLVTWQDYAEEMA